MSNLMPTNQNDLIAIEKALVEGDLKPLSVQQRIAYITKMCADIGLLATTKPFDFIMFQGRLIAYPNKNCAEQLRRRDNITIKVVSRDKFDNLVSITVRATNPQGREDESTAYLDITGLSGQNLANAMMKLETKAKRRVTLSFCGLGMNDESEWADVESAIPVSVDFDDPKTINDNLDKAKEAEKKEEQKKPKNETPITTEQRKQLLEKAEMIGLKSTDLKSVIEQLWALSDSKNMKVYQFEILFDLICKAKTRDEFGKVVSAYEEEK